MWGLRRDRAERDANRSAPLGQRGNRYRRQRRVGFPWLMFMPDLEREYQESFFLTTRMRIRIVSGLSVCGVLVFLLLDQLFGTARMIEPAAWLLSLLGIPLISVAFVATFRSRFTKQLRMAVLGSFIGFGAVLTISILWSRQSHPDMPYESLVVLTFADYLLSGLGLFQALAAGLALFLFYLGGTFVFGVHDAGLVYEVFYMLLANLIGLVGLYVLDYQARQSFLATSELRLLSIQDGLTGLLNRRAFRHHLGKLRLQARRESKALGLMRVDLDHFKRINDEHGHAHGDHALRALGAALGGLARRPLDAAGRVGGDEFEAVWYDVDMLAFSQFEAQLRRALRDQLQRLGLDPDSVRFSGGVHWVHPGDPSSVKDLLHRLDEALHAAKRGGRDRLLDTVQFMRSSVAE